MIYSGVVFSLNCSQCNITNLAFNFPNKQQVSATQAVPSHRGQTPGLRKLGSTATEEQNEALFLKITAF